MCLICDLDLGLLEGAGKVQVITWVSKHKAQKVPLADFSLSQDAYTPALRHVYDRLSSVTPYRANAAVCREQTVFDTHLIKTKALEKNYQGILLLQTKCVSSNRQSRQARW